MYITYPAIFFHESDGQYSVVFPDLNHLATYGETLDEARKMAVDALTGYISTELEYGEQIPAPTDRNHVDPAKEMDTEDSYSADDISIEMVTADEKALLLANKRLGSAFWGASEYSMAKYQMNFNRSRLFFRKEKSSLLKKQNGKSISEDKAIKKPSVSYGSGNQVYDKNTETRKFNLVA